MQQGEPAHGRGHRERGMLVIENIPIAQHGKRADLVTGPSLAAEVLQPVVGVAFDTRAPEKSRSCVDGDPHRWPALRSIAKDEFSAAFDHRMEGVTADQSFQPFDLWFFDADVVEIAGEPAL